jgi:chorismate mutase
MRARMNVKEQLLSFLSERQTATSVVARIKERLMMISSRAQHRSSSYSTTELKRKNMNA